MSEHPDLEFLGWDAAGLRVPNHRVDFRMAESSRTYPVSVLQMPNGTGKTTTLQLLRAALSGSAEDWDPVKVRTFAKRGNESGKGHFTLKARSLGNLWTIQLNLDFDLGEVSYLSTLASGQRIGFHPPLHLASIARQGLVDFFIFDGELAERLLDQHANNAGYAIEQFFRLDILRSMQEAVQAHWERQTKDVTARQEKGYNRRKNLFERLSKLFAEREEERELTAKELEAAQGRLERRETKYRDAIEANKSRKDKNHQLLYQQRRAEDQLRARLDRAMQLVRSPIGVIPFFAVEAERLRDRLDRVKLPESAAREFFEELSEEDRCVCGRLLGESERQAIRERAERYLGSDNVSLLNALKSQVSDALATANGKPWMELEKQLQDIKRLDSQLGTINTQLEALEAETAHDSPELEAALEDIKDTRAQIERLQAKLDRYDAPSDANSNEADVLSTAELRRRHRKADRDLAEITDTLRVREQRDTLKLLLEAAVESARNQLILALVENTNTNIARLMPNNHIRVEEIQRALKLEGQAGGSVGETLSVAYSFLATLFQESSTQVPLVVDSPAGPIDLAVRPEVAALAPQLTHQFVAFTISTEREGFVEPLARGVHGDVQYLTLFRKGDSSLEASARDTGDSMAESEDGILVEDKKYFEGFHRDQEGKR